MASKHEHGEPKHFSCPYIPILDFKWLSRCILTDILEAAGGYMANVIATGGATQFHGLSFVSHILSFVRDKTSHQRHSSVLIAVREPAHHYILHQNTATSKRANALSSTYFRTQTKHGYEISTPSRKTQASPRHSLFSKCHMVSQQTRQLNSLYALPAPIVTKITKR